MASHRLTSVVSSLFSSPSLTLFSSPIISFFGSIAFSARTSLTAPCQPRLCHLSPTNHPLGAAFSPRLSSLGKRKYRPKRPCLQDSGRSATKALHAKRQPPLHKLVVQRPLQDLASLHLDLNPTLVVRGPHCLFSLNTVRISVSRPDSDWSLLLSPTPCNHSPCSVSPGASLSQCCHASRIWK